MSGKTAKIDLSMCKVGDKAMTRDGHTLTFKGRRDGLAYPYVFGCSCGHDHSFNRNGRYILSIVGCPEDIVELLPREKPAPKPKAAKKPRRLENDPEGYDPVFDDGCDACARCALDRIDGLCNPGTPCSQWERPEGRGIHYVKASAKPTAKKPSVPKLRAGQVRVADCVGKFLVVEGDKNGGVIDLESPTVVRGPFKSILAAEKDIRDDAIDTFDGDPGNSLSDLENWGSDCLIVEVKRAVRPVPTVKVGCEIKTIAGGDSNAR